VDVDFANEGVGAMDPTRLGRWFRVRRIITRRKEGALQDAVMQG